MSWGAVGASAVNLIGGELLGGDEGGGGTTTVQSSRAQPFRVGGGLFTANFGAGQGRGFIGDRGAVQRARRRRERRRGGGGGGRTIPPGFVQVDSGQIVPQNSRPANQLNIIARAGQTARGSGGGGGGGGGGRGKQGLQLGFDPRLEAIIGQSLGGASQFFDRAINNQTADLAGQLGFDFLSNVQPGVFLDIAQNQFDLVSPILQQGFDEGNLDFEARQLAQGRLGSTAGQRDANARFDSQNDALRLLLADSLQQGLSTQAQQVALGTQLSQFDPALRGLFGQLGANFVNTPLAIQDAALRNAALGGSLAGANTSGVVSQNNPSLGQQLGAGLINSGIEGLTGALQGIDFTSGDPGGAPNRGTGITGGGR